MVMDIRQTNCPSRHKGALRVFRGKQFKSLGKLSDWHQLWFTSADSSGNGHRLNYKSSLNTPGGISAAGGGGVRVSQIQKSWEAVKRLDRLAPTLFSQIQKSGKLSNGCTDWHQIWYTSADSSGNGHRLNTIRPSICHGAFGG